VLAPGDVILMATLRTQADAEAFDRATPPAEGRRLRRVRVVRDYGKYDRREAPQFHPDATGAPTIHD
jgi:hypothetical protein